MADRGDEPCPGFYITTPVTLADQLKSLGLTPIEVTYVSFSRLHFETVMIMGNHDVFGDSKVRIVTAPGHTPGHQVLELQLSKTGNVGLSGDLYPMRASRQIKRVPGLNNDRAATLALMDRVEKVVRNKHAQLVVQHDRQDFDALPKLPASLDWTRGSATR